jgi:hypothetical protein
MKTFKQLLEDCGCEEKEDNKVKGKKKKAPVEIMPNIPDGKKGMVSKPNNQ